MQKGNNPSTQHDLNNKLRQIQALVGNCIDLVSQLPSTPSKSAQSSKQTQRSDTSVRFDMNERAFVKRYAKNLSGGPKKFTLILAYLAKRNMGKEVSLNEIEQLWNRTSSKTLLGMKFNRFFPTVAKENGWVDSKKR